MVEGSHCKVDHQPLAYLRQAKLTNGRLMRWSLYLQQYNVHVQYIKGSDNIGANYLSRMGLSCVMNFGEIL